MGRGGWREASGWAAAGAIGVIVTGQLATSARSDLLFRDGDSLVVALFTRSVLDGQPLDWAFSSVLFLPESAVFGLLQWGLPWLSANALLAVNAVLNLMALYGALRIAAGRREPGRAPVLWSVMALTAYGALVLTEQSVSREALEPASMLLTTTYYSATVVAAVTALGLVRRFVDGGRRRVLVALGAVAAISTLSNPLFAVWAVVPLGVLLAIGAVRRRDRTLVPLTVLVGAMAVGLVGRIPLSAWIASSGAGYAQPGRWRESLDFYGALVADRLISPGGVAAALLTLALVVLCVHRTVTSTGGSRLVAAFGWVAPLLVVVGAIALGTNAARYLAPMAFAPVLVLVARPIAVRMPRRVAVAMALGAAPALVIATAVSVPRAASAVNAVDRDLDCVTDWVTASGRTGAGQYWTVRLPKLHLDDPSRLVQVDHTLNGYAWLVNRTDFEIGEVSFLLEDAQTAPWQIDGLAVERIVECGRYTILDFPGHPLPLGPARS